MRQRLACAPPGSGPRPEAATLSAALRDAGATSPTDLAELSVAEARQVWPPLAEFWAPLLAVLLQRPASASVRQRSRSRERPRPAQRATAALGPAPFPPASKAPRTAAALAPAPSSRTRWRARSKRMSPSLGRIVSSNCNAPAIIGLFVSQKRVRTAAGGSRCLRCNADFRLLSSTIFELIKRNVSVPRWRKGRSPFPFLFVAAARTLPTAYTVMYCYNCQYAPCWVAHDCSRTGENGSGFIGRRVYS